MLTILALVLLPFGINMASNFAYDLFMSTKTGKKLIDSFTNKFVNKKDFSDNSDAEDFFQYISEKKVANKDEAEKYAKSWYEKRTGQKDSQDFINDLTNWLKENKEQFSDLSMTNVQAGILNTGTQCIIGDVETTTIGGNQTNHHHAHYHGKQSNDPQDEKKNS